MRHCGYFLIISHNRSSDPQVESHCTPELPPGVTKCLSYLKMGLVSESAVFPHPQGARQRDKTCHVVLITL